MRINYDFTDLEAFLAVKETGSFHLAAERLNLSQSSITRRVRKLEAALGSTLFERSTRNVRPTLAAKRLHMRAEAILEDARETSRAMRDESAVHAHQRVRTVTVATIPTVVPDLIAPAIRVFLEGRDGARLRLMDLAANEVAEAVAQGEADFGLCSIPMLEPATDFELLFDDPLVLAVPKTHHLAGRGLAGQDLAGRGPAGKDRVDWSDLDGEALILPSRGTGNRLLIDEALARTRLPMHWTFEVGRSTTALDLVAQGIGLAPLPRSSVLAQRERPIAWLPITAPDVTRSIGLLRRSGQRDGSAAAALIEAIRARAEILGGRGNGR